MAPDLRAKLQQVAQETLAQFDCPGAVVAIRTSGQPAFECGIGYQDINRNQAMPPDARFYIYSVTKPLIAALAQERLDLDTSFPTQNLNLDSPITLRQILSHTSGLPDYGPQPAYQNAVRTGPGLPWGSAEFLELAQIQGLQSPPGTDWRYSNIGYLLVKNHLEQQTGLSLGELLHQRLFQPLGLRHTFVPVDLSQVDLSQVDLSQVGLSETGSLTPGYSGFWGELQDMTQIYHPGWVAHGVVASTASELALLLEALLTNRLVPLGQMDQAVHSLGHFPLFERLSYGLGLFLSSGRYGLVRGHTGEGPGYSVAAFHLSNLAAAPTTIAVCVNRDQPDTGLVLLYRLARAMAEHRD